MTNPLLSPFAIIPLEPCPVVTHVKIVSLQFAVSQTEWSYPPYTTRRSVHPDTSCFSPDIHVSPVQVGITKKLLERAGGKTVILDVTGGRSPFNWRLIPDNDIPKYHQIRSILV